MGATGRTGTRATTGRRRGNSGKSAAGAADFSSQIAAMAHEQIEAQHAARRAMIEQAAYFRAERRGFEPGHELEDWLAAEAEVRALDNGPTVIDVSGMQKREVTQ